MKAQELISNIEAILEQMETFRNAMKENLEVIKEQLETHKVAFNHQEAKINYRKSAKGKERAREGARRYYAKKKAKKESPKTAETAETENANL